MKKLVVAIAFLYSGLSIAQNSDLKPDLTEIAKIENGLYRFVIDTTKFKSEVTESLITNAKDLVFDKIQVLHQPILGSTKDSIYLLQIKLSAKKATISRPLLRNGEKLYLVNNQTFHGSFGMTYLMCQRRESNSDLCEANVFSIEDKLASGCGTDPKCVAPGTELPCKSFKAVILPEN